MNNRIYQKGFANIILIIAIVVLVGTVGYFAFVKKSTPPTQNITGQTTPTNNSDSEKSVIKLPFIDMGGAVELNDKDIIGCGDKIVYVSKEIAATTQPLNAAYKELFATGPTIRFEGKELINPIADQAKEQIITYNNRPADVFRPLRFVKAEIQGNVAMVYLEGDLVSNECNDPRVEAQIILTAKQLPSVSEVKTFLNGNEFNWSKWMDQQG